MSESTPATTARRLATPVVRRRVLDRALTICGVLGDVALLQLAMTLAYWVRFRSGWIPVTKGEPLSRDAYLAALPAVTAVWVVVFAWLDMYRPQRWAQVLDEAYNVLIAAVVVLMVCLALSFTYRAAEFSRLTVALGFGIAVVLAVLARAVGLRLAASLRRRPELRRRVALLGVDDLAATLAGEDREIAFQGPAAADALAAARELMAQGRVDELVLRRSAMGGDELIELLRECEVAGAEVVVVAEPVDLLLRRGGREDAGGWPLVRVRDVPLSGTQRLIKRLLDVVVSAALLIILSPLLAVVALLVRLTSPGPALFRQVRVTEGGREFEMLKFRSMVQDAEAQTGPIWARKGDPRTTPVGRLLRRTSLDELPQFWNVLVGDMSLIGPRPERPVFVEQFAAQLPRYRDRHRMKTGITGWAQVTGERGGDSGIEERTRYDLFYIDNWSLMLDLRILVKTLFEVLFHRGAG